MRTEDLQGRVALVTGACGPIGAAIAKRLAACGAAVAVNHLGEEAKAQALLDEIRAAGASVAAFVADVGDVEQVEGMVAQVAAELGPPDLLVNNAAVGVHERGQWHSFDVGYWERTLRVNVIGPYLCAQALRGHFATAGGGDVINVASIMPLLGAVGNLPYVASKAAVIGLTRGLAREVGDAGVRVNAVAVGAIQTEGESALGDRARIDAQVLDSQALRRRGLPEDVAAAVGMLASPQARFVTGQCLVVDGGWVMS